MNYGLPTSVEINGKEFAIESDYRKILDIMAAVNDSTLDEKERLYIILKLFYIDAESLEYDDILEASEKCLEFVNHGADGGQDNMPRLVKWEQDFDLIIAPINKSIGHDVRSVDYMHWWTFISYFQEIGDCLFSQVASIRYKKATGKPLDKMDREFYNMNRAIIDFKGKYTKADNALLENWVKGVQ